MKGTAGRGFEQEETEETEGMHVGDSELCFRLFHKKIGCPCLFVPKGRTTIAQRFIAGERGLKALFTTSPVGTTERIAHASTVPTGRRWGLEYPLLPSDESLGYCQPTLRVDIPVNIATFAPKNLGNDKA